MSLFRLGYFSCVHVQQRGDEGVGAVVVQLGPPDCASAASIDDLAVGGGGGGCCW